MALSIQDPETEQLAYDLAQRTGKSVDIAVRHALEERLQRLTPDIRKTVLLEDMAASRRRWSAMPVLDRRHVNDIINYDENGLPN